MTLITKLFDSLSNLYISPLYHKSLVLINTPLQSVFIRFNNHKKPMIS